VQSAQVSSRISAPDDPAGAGWYFFESPKRKPLGSNECQRRLIALAAIRGEVNNGGFHQFFFNSSGHLGSDALSAARDAGDMVLASIIGDALSKFGERVPDDRDARQTALLGMPDDEFQELDRAYFQHEEMSDLDDLMDRYVWSHAAEFFKR
jgi:Domain of unknown function (DUF4375)